MDLNKEKIEEFRREFLKNTEKCITQTFPEQILTLNKILESPDFSITGVMIADYELDVSLVELFERHTMHVEERKNRSDKSLNSMIKKEKAKLGIMPTHKTLKELLEIVSPFFQQLLKDASSIRMWLTCLTPKIEDGNNFGVNLQHKIRHMVYHIECLNNVYFSNVTVYNDKRGKLCAKLVKYPYVEDYMRAVDMLDEQHHLYLTYFLHLIRDSYVSINDLIVKNWGKIITPRNTNTLCLY